MIHPFSIFLYLTFLICFQHNTLEVRIENIPERKGNLIVAIYNRPAGFPRKPLIRKIIKVQSQDTVVRFGPLNSGLYAVSVVLDKNGNRKLDFYFFGPPKEKVVFSRYAKASFGPPGFEDAAFIVNKKHQTIVIDLKK